VRALRGVDFELRRGELVVLLGPSGSGKSTLLNLLGGLDVATAGTLSYAGQDLSRATEEALTAYRRAHVGFVFQFYNLIPSLTARENVALVSDIASRPMSPDEALALVGLAPRGRHYPSQLSGGEQQRVAIARAIVKRPELLLCDEPTGNLDQRAGREITALFERLNAEDGVTVVLVTHDPLIARRARRNLRIVDGELIYDGPPLAALEAPAASVAPA